MLTLSGRARVIEIPYLVLAEEKATDSAVAAGQGKTDDLAPVCDAINSAQTAAEGSKILHFPVPVEEGAGGIAVARTADDLAVVVDASEEKLKLSPLTTPRSWIVLPTYDFQAEERNAPFSRLLNDRRWHN